MLSFMMIEQIDLEQEINAKNKQLNNLGYSEGQIDKLLLFEKSELIIAQLIKSYASLSSPSARRCEK